MFARILLALALLVPGVASAGQGRGPIVPIDLTQTKRPMLPPGTETATLPVTELPVVKAPIAPPTATKAPPTVHDLLTTPHGQPAVEAPCASTVPPLPTNGPATPPPPAPPPPYLRTTPTLPTTATVPVAGTTQVETARPETKP